MIQSRVINNLHYEKPTKYFCRLEKQRFIDKTIRKLTLKDGSTIISPKDILKGIKDFYANLFSIHDGHSQHEVLNDLDNYCSIDHLDEKKAILLEGEITIKELGEAFSKMKNNKTPELDGFPTDFFKVFLVEIEFFCFTSTK